MDSRTAAVLAILGYLLAVAGMLWLLRRALDEGGEQPPPVRAAGLSLGVLAMTCHAIALLGTYDAGHGPNFSFLGALSLVTLSINAMLMLTALFRPVDKLALITFPLASAVLLAKLALPEETRGISNHSWPMATHIFASLLAYSLLNIAALQALLLAVQDHCLRSHHPDGYLLRSLPSLQSMENLMFQLIGAGLLLLTLSLATGFIFLENLFAQHLAHKTVLSILAWLVFAVLLVGRQRYGWRGQTAVRWTLGGFVALMLAYFGSKMVLELILGRT